MEVQQLRYFCALAEERGFSRAAARCHVSQPSLSQQIAKLEAELGARLLDRLRRGARLTAAGEALLPRARAALAEMAAARGEVAAREEAAQGTLAVGAIPTVAPYLLPRALARLARRYPAARVQVVEEITPLLLERLRAGGLDWVLAALPLPGRTREFVAAPVLEEPVLAALPAAHPLARRARIGLRELRREPLLLLRDGHCFRTAALAACRRARWRPRVAPLSFDSGQFSTLLALVGAGLGVTLVPAMAVTARRDCRFLPLAEGGARTLALVRLKRRPPSPLAGRFAAEIRAAAR